MKRGRPKGLRHTEETKARTRESWAQKKAAKRLEFHVTALPPKVCRSCGTEFHQRSSETNTSFLKRRTCGQCTNTAMRRTVVTTRQQVEPTGTGDTSSMEVVFASRTWLSVNFHWLRHYNE